MKSLKLFALSSVFVILTACGGGGDDFGFIELPTYGSIAVNPVTGAAGITTNYSTQNSANTEALKKCGLGCLTAMEIKSYRCGALARAATKPIFGWGSDSKLSDAKSKALSSCQNNNGIGCEIVLDGCNT